MGDNDPVDKRNEAIDDPETVSAIAGGTTARLLGLS
jgi:hypothetical protein